MRDLFDHEKNKYNLIHRYTGIEKNQVGYGRQINELLTLDFPFHSKWRELLNSNSSFLEVGIGAGEILFFYQEKNIDYFGIDISDFVIDELRERGLNLKQSSCHDISFPNNSFDVVTHLDGMEHIPLEWERQSVREEIRVSRKYVFQANAMGEAYLDHVSKLGGFDEVHVNIKNESGWDSFYTGICEEIGCKIIMKGVLNDTYYIILEK